MNIPQLPHPGVQGDWLEDHGLDRGLSEPPLAYPFYGHGHGYGHGHCHGHGDGHGYGHGDGHGHGHGDGHGHGKYQQPQRQAMPIVGKRMLVFCGLSFAFVGDVIEQTGPYSYTLANASMLCRTGGVPWDELADGNRRNEATYRYQGTISVGPFFSWARTWEGKLPGKNHKANEIA